MLKVKKIIKEGMPILVTYLLSYLIILILCLIYTAIDYQNLSNFQNTTCIYIMLLYYFLITIYFYQKNKKKEATLSVKKYFPLIYLGISLATFMNMITFKINPPKNIETLPIMISFVPSGIIGPIYEEIIFRYVFYNRLKTFLSIKKSMFITTIIFSILHLSPIKIIYAFILGVILVTLYEKEKNILAPILIHMSANTIVLFLTNYNSIILILATLNLTISLYLNFKTKKG